MAFGRATVVFLDGRRVEAQNVTATPDSTSFLEIPEGLRFTVPTHTIDKIINKDSFVGWLEASGIGLLAGAGTGALVAAVAGGGNSYAVVGLIAVGATAGVLVGGITGLILGHTYEYKFAHEWRRP
jgi:hypothetical protein